MVICLERVADLHMSQLMPLPLTVCCFSKIQIGFTFLVPAYPGSPGKGPLNGCSIVVVDQVLFGFKDFLVQRLLILCLIKRIPSIFSCNSRVHSWILIIFGRNLLQKAGN